jgi:hypothetical protein
MAAYDLGAGIGHEHARQNEADAHGCHHASTYPTRNLVAVAVPKTCGENQQHGAEHHKIDDLDPTQLTNASFADETSRGVITRLDCAQDEKYRDEEGRSNKSSPGQGARHGQSHYETSECLTGANHVLGDWPQNFQCVLLDMLHRSCHLMAVCPYGARKRQRG